MVDVPETRYAQSGGVYIAYQVVESGGPIDYVCLPPSLSNIDVLWENPEAARFMRRLAKLGRYVHYDKRGQGMSDRGVRTPDLDTRVEDLVAVMDAVGVERAVIAGASEGGATAVLFAATHPERVSHLITYGASACIRRRPHFPDGFDDATLESFFDAWAQRWGTPETLTLPFGCQSMTAAGDSFLRWLNRYERQSSSPGDFRASLGWIAAIDVTSILSSISVPTLVIQSRDDRMVPLAQGRYLAEHIPGARYLEVEGVDHVPWWGKQDLVLDAIEEFVLGETADPDPDRTLATVLFSDIVASTDRAAAVGDGAWRRILDDHDHLVRREVERHGGRVVKTTGDGAMATFDRPGRAVLAAAAARDELRTIGLEVRAGVHTGEVEVRGDDIGGIAVHIAARVAALAGAGEVLVSRTVCDLVVGSGLTFTSIGDHDLKGVPGRWELHRLTA